MDPARVRPFLNVVDTILSRIESVAIVALSLAALALGVSQVVLRYVFNTGFTWSEAIFIIMTVAAMLVGGSRAVRDDGHVRVDLLPQLAPRSVQRWMRLARYLLSLALCGFFAFAGYRYLQFTHMMGTISPDSGLPDWTVALIVPAALGLFCLRYLILILREAGGEETGEAGSPEARDPIHGQDIGA